MCKFTSVKLACAIKVTAEMFASATDQSIERSLSMSACVRTRKKFIHRKFTSLQKVDEVYIQKVYKFTKVNEIYDPSQQNQFLDDFCYRGHNNEIMENSLGDENLRDMTKTYKKNKTKMQIEPKLPSS